MKLVRDAHVIIGYGRKRDWNTLRTGARSVQRINERSPGLGYRRAAVETCTRTTKTMAAGASCRHRDTALGIGILATAVITKVI
jgi:hypothetical protein